ncbi:MAG: DUF1565 domain-containing protein [Phycisphaeraceae bacterium JB051]
MKYADKSHLFPEIQTRRIVPTLGQQTDLYVSPAGSDQNAGTEDRPFRTILHAVKQNQPGTTINVLPGRYTQTININNLHASEEKPLVIRSVEKHKAVIDNAIELSANKTDWQHHANGVFVATVDLPVKYLTEDGYWSYHYATLAELVRGYPEHSSKVPDWKRSIPRGWYYDEAAQKLYVQISDKAHPSEHILRVSSHTHGFDINNSSWIYIDGFTITHNSIAAVGMSDNTDNVRVTNNLMHHNGIGVTIRDNTCDNNLAYRNTIYATGVLDYDWTLVKHGNCLCKGFLFNAGRGNSIIQNHIFGLFDAIQVVSWHTQEGRNAYNPDSDILDNYIHDCLDDGLEPDGGGVNMRIVGNYMRNINMSGISLAPIDSGPVYVVRNVQINSGWTAFKFKVGGTPSNGVTHIYHNTSYGTQMAMCLPLFPPKGVEFKNKFIMNNVFAVTRYGIFNGHGNNVIDHNAYWKIDQPHTVPMFWANDQKEFVRYDQMQAFKRVSSSEQQGVVVDPLFVDANTDNLNLQTNSPLIDRALKIRGINDQYVGRGPDIGAVEYGQDLNQWSWVKPMDIPLGKGKQIKVVWKIKNGLKDKQAIKVSTKDNIEAFTIDYKGQSSWGYAAKPVTGKKLVDEQIEKVTLKIKGDGSDTTIGFFIMTDKDSFVHELPLANTDWQEVSIPLKRSAFKDINSEGTGELELSKIEYVGFYFKGNIKAAFSVKDVEPKLF